MLKNSVTLIGCVGSEPQVKAVGNNSKIARFSVAVQERYRNADNEWVENTQWFPIVAWASMADRAEKVAEKGRLLAIEGSLHNNEWTDKDGNRHSVTEVWMDSCYPIQKPERDEQPADE